MKPSSRKRDSIDPKVDELLKNPEVWADGVVGQGTPPTPLRFEEKSFAGFDVEFTTSGDNIIYHFFPPKGSRQFPAGDQAFGRKLEQAFKKNCPEDADVRADYKSWEEAHVLGIMRASDDPTSPDYAAQATFHVEVKDLAHVPMADKFFKRRVFKDLAESLKES